jgi:hypothetical protein
MNFNFSFPVVIDDKIINVKEITFYDYKNICKSLYNQSDTKTLSNIFNKIITTYVECSESLDIREKILTLLNIRGLTLGKEIKINYDNKNVNLSVDYLISKLSSKQLPFEYEHNDIKFTFGLPDNFILTENDIVTCICESLISIDAEGVVINVKSLDTKQKNELLNSLPSIPLIEVYKAIYDNYKDVGMIIPVLDNFKLNLFDNSFLHFLKFIFDEKIDTVLDLEYNLRRHLNYNSNDLINVTYPESKIMLNKFANEAKDKNNNESGKSINPA